MYYAYSLCIYFGSVLFLMSFNIVIIPSVAIKKYIKIEKIKKSPSNHENATSVRSAQLAVLKMKL